MKPKSIYWGEHTWEELAEIARSGAVVVAPFGSTEQHGPMLPVDTDVHIAQRWADNGGHYAAERLGVPTLVLPVMPFGLAEHHMRFAGTISIEPETYVVVAAQVLRSVLRHGFRRIALLSGHGGNRPGLDLAMKKAVAEADRPVRIALFQDHRDRVFAPISEKIWEEEPDQGQVSFHASRWETSETLADRPHLVRRDRMVRPQLTTTERPEWSWVTHEISPSGATGDPSMARADLGQQIWEGWAQAVGEFIRRLWELELPE